MGWLKIKVAFVGSSRITVTREWILSVDVSMDLLDFKRSFKGAFQPDYSASNPAMLSGKMVNLSFQLAKATSGYYRLAGNIQPLVDNGK